MSTPKNIPKHGAPSPATRKTSAQNPLVRSPAQAEREKTTLRKGREQLESDPRIADTSIRTSIL